MKTDYYKQFREGFSRMAPMLPTDWALYEDSMELMVYKKKHLITKAGDIENYIYFILDGVARIYFEKEGREICVNFGFEGNLIADYASFITREPALLNVQALTPLTVFRVSYSTIQEINEASKSHEHFARKIAEHLFVKQSQREMLLLSMTAEEKYTYLLRKKPYLVRQIPVKYLASYLGIHPESLSRIRRKLSQNN